MSSANIAQPIQLLACAREDLACYSVAQWPQFERAPHHELMNSKLEGVERGEINRLMIFLPPRHGKSFLTSSIFPARFLGRHPHHDVIFATYGQELSDDFGRRVRNFVAAPVHQAIFPDCKLCEDSTAAHRFNATANGAYFAVGRGSARTSWRARTSTRPATPIPCSWRLVGFTCCCRILSATSSCCGFRRPHESTNRKTTQASLGLGFLSGALSADYAARWLAMPAMRKFQRSPGSSHAAAKPFRSGCGRESHHPLQCMPPANPFPSRDAGEVRAGRGIR